MATTKRDTAYSTFITQVATQFDNMSREEVTELLADITKRMDYEIDCKKESEIYSEARLTLSDEEIKIKNDEQDRIQLLKEEMEEEPMEDDSEDTMEI